MMCHYCLFMYFEQMSIIVDTLICVDKILNNLYFVFHFFIYLYRIPISIASAVNELLAKLCFVSGRF